MADSLGANVIVSSLQKDERYRLPLVESLGIETVTTDETDLAGLVETATDGIGFDVVFDTTGHKSGVEMTADATRKGGQIVVVGLPGERSELFMTPLVRGEIDLNTSYGSVWRDFEQALRLMERGDIPLEEIIDDSFGIDDPAAAFEAFLDAETLKPVFRFGD
jgi:L-iditol 2-dehydrogenase